MELFRRENYLRKIRGFYHDDEIIKVITGVRRCGKSCLMQTVAQELVESGISSAVASCGRSRLPTSSRQRSIVLPPAHLTD